MSNTPQKPAPPPVVKSAKAFIPPKASINKPTPDMKGKRVLYEVLEPGEQPNGDVDEGTVVRFANDRVKIAGEDMPSRNWYKIDQIHIEQVLDEEPTKEVSAEPIVLLSEHDRKIAELKKEHEAAVKSNEEQIKHLSDSVQAQRVQFATDKKKLEDDCNKKADQYNATIQELRNKIAALKKVAYDSQAAMKAELDKS